MSGRVHEYGSMLLTESLPPSSSNWESYLRAQYEAREPKNLLLGTAESPLPWAALPLTAKVNSHLGMPGIPSPFSADHGFYHQVDTIYTLCEWQLVDAERFRKLVKNDEDAQIWVRRERESARLAVSGH